VEGGGAVVPLVESQREALPALCRQYGVARLELFGSAATAARESR